MLLLNAYSNCCCMLPPAVSVWQRYWIADVFGSDNRLAAPFGSAALAGPIDCLSGHPNTELDPKACRMRLLPAPCCSGQLATKSSFLVQPDSLTATCRLQAQASQLLAAAWIQCHYALPSSLPDHAHLTVRSLEVACSTSGSPGGTAIALLAYLGESSQPQVLQLMTGTN